MQQQTQLSKQEILAWKMQLKITQLQDNDIEEALELIAESTLQLYVVLQELDINKETCKRIYRPDLQDKLNQKNSIVLKDPSNQNKIVAIRIFRDVTQLDSTPPKEEDFGFFPKYFVKAKLNHELMKPIYEQNYEPNDSEITLIFNVHPDYSKMGLSEYLIYLYGKHAYSRGIKNSINIYYSEVMLGIIMKIKLSKPQVLKEVDLQEESFEGETLFKLSKKGYLVTSQFNDEVIASIGLQKLVEIKQQNKLQFSENQFYKC